MQYEIQAINERVERESRFVPVLQKSIQRVIVGQQYLIDRLLIGLLADGHVLIEGVPGLAKTLSVKTLAASVDTKFQRIQFTPDLLPADLVGTLIYNPRDDNFSAKKGPIFANIILADEINRAPAKVQSALLEAMQERQVTIGDKTYPLEIRSWCWPRRTRSSRKGHIRCPKRRSTASCSSSRSTIRPAKKSARSWRS